MSYYAYNEETGMEYEHDGQNTRRQWHDGVGQVSEHRQSLGEFLALMGDMGADVSEVDS